MNCGTIPEKTAIYIPAGWVTIVKTTKTSQALGVRRGLLVKCSKAVEQLKAVQERIKDPDPLVKLQFEAVEKA